MNTLWQRLKEFYSLKNSKRIFVDLFAIYFLTIIVTNIDRLMEGSGAYENFMFVVSIFALLYLLVRMGFFIAYMFMGASKLKPQGLAMIFGKSSPMVPAGSVTTVQPSKVAAPGDDEVITKTVGQIKLENSYFRGTNVLMQIGIFSVVNTLISIVYPSVTFVIGLGISMIFDAFGIAFRSAGYDALTVNAIVVGLSVAFSSIFYMLGKKANEGSRGAIKLALVLYVLDTLLILWMQDFIALAFHGYFLYQIYQGLKAYDGLAVVTQKPAAKKKPKKKEAK